MATFDEVRKVKKVYFFVGPEKTGTTTVFDMLLNMNNVRQKESFNLSRKMSLSNELERIEKSDDEIVIIIEPSYYTSLFALESIASLQANFNVIVVSTHRDRLNRCISHYLHHKLKGRIKNVKQGFEEFPEIIKASNYEFFDALWSSKIDTFCVWDIDSMNFSFGTHLDSIGIKHNSPDHRSNPRIAPRSQQLSKYATVIWDAMIGIGLNRLVPNRFKRFLREVIYFGGRHPVVSQAELNDISHYLNAEIYKLRHFDVKNPSYDQDLEICLSEGSRRVSHSQSGEGS
jgi:hypothetical protein